MQRFRITVAYDGTAYAGWQAQPSGNTVQQVIQAAIARLSGDTVVLHGSGRTDAGVHARAQEAHFDSTAALTVADWKRGLNAVLPPDIRVDRVRPVSPDFHARRSATAKEYRYLIWNADVMPPFLRAYRTAVRERLDIEAMRAAAAVLTGRHDFAAFTANPNREVDGTVRTLSRLTVTRRGSDVTLLAVGDGFLYKQVRSLAGYLIRVGTGAVPVAETPGILASCRRTARVPTAPPEGLFLWRVWYRQEARGQRSERKVLLTSDLWVAGEARLRRTPGPLGATVSAAIRP